MFESTWGKTSQSLKTLPQLAGHTIVESFQAAIVMIMIELSWSMGHCHIMSYPSFFPESIYIYIYILVGGFNHLEKYESQWEGWWEGWHPICEMEHKQSCLKPPNRYIYIYIHLKSQLIIGIINTNLAIGLEHHLAITLVFFQAQSSWTTLTSGKGDKPYAIPAIPDGFNPWKLNWGRTWYGDEVITDCFLQVL